MTRLILVATIFVGAGCKSSTSLVKEKPIADPLYTSKVVSLQGVSSGVRVPERIPLPPPPPDLTLPSPSDNTLRLADDR